MSKTFFSGLEEALARVSSLLINALFFTIFMLARGQNLNLDWIGVLQVLGIFWLLYEVVGLILFEMFKFFSNRLPEHLVLNQTQTNQTVTTNQNSPQTQTDGQTPTESTNTESN